MYLPGSVTSRCVPRVCGGDPGTVFKGCGVKFVFPVYAGVIPKPLTIKNIGKGVPRVCGGDPDG